VCLRKKVVWISAITLRNINGFSKFYQCWQEDEMSKKRENFHQTLNMLPYYLAKCRHSDTVAVFVRESVSS